MDYTNPIHRYQRTNFDFGGGADDNMVAIGPKGKEGLLYDYGVYDITETFNGDTLDPKISVGTASDPDHYGDELTLSTALCAADGGGTSVLTQFAPGSVNYNLYMLIRNLPMDTAVYCVMSASTGANLTGQGTPFMDIIWAK